MGYTFKLDVEQDRQNLVNALNELSKEQTGDDDDEEQK